MRLFMLAMIATAGVSTASADDHDHDHDHDLDFDLEHGVHLQVEPGFRMGDVELDGQSSFGAGVVVDAVVRRHALAAVVELAEVGVSPYSFASTTAHSSVSGTTSTSAPMTTSGGLLDRDGIAARYYFAMLPDTDRLGLVLDSWLSIGVGRETFQWDVGGVLARTDVAVGIGGTFGVHGDRWWAGTSSAIYLVYAARRDDPQAATCGGPCDMATHPSANDRSIIWDITIPFGQ